jgi:ABC-type multidrug transport system ATPase subunit
MIQTNGISKTFEEITALRNIDLSVEEGELFGLIGPDGAGKTTLFRILASLMLPTAGTAIVNGYDVIKDYKKIRASIGYMPGRFSLYQDLSVEENLHFYATIFGTTIKENYDLIRDIYVQIEPFKKRLAGKLSGGMKQKLALSCALIHKPDLLILDEPTFGVDAVSRKEFWEMLQKLKTRGMTILVSTPYMDEASLCDRIALIQGGEILQINTPSEIRKSYPKQLFAIAAADTYRLLADLKAYEHTKTVCPFGMSVHYTDQRDAIDPDEIKDYLASRDHEDVSVEQIEANIEDCFMELMN